MPTQLPPREPATAELSIRCGRYIAGIAILLVALVLFKLRLVQSASAAVRPYFLDETRPLSVGTSSVTVAGVAGARDSSRPLLFWIQNLIVSAVTR